MDTVAVVTGSNQGLGFALVERLCRDLGPDAIVYLTARDLARGAEAVQQLESKGLSPRLHPLDVTNDASVTALADRLRAEHGGVDIVISNAAARISKELTPAEQVAAFIDTNNHGTFRVIRALGPLLRENSRFLVVASGFGSLKNLPPHLHDHFDTETKSLEEMEHLMDHYVRLVETGQATAQGWSEWINIPSKIAQVASIRIFARLMSEEARRKGILIDAVCPGLVDTAASRPWFEDMSSAQSPSQAAVDVAWLATLPAGTAEPYGELVQHRRIIPWR
jgi:carbonyl reductase 1